MRVVLAFLLAISLILVVSPSSQGQLVPEVEVDCDHPSPIDVYPGATRTTIVYCTIQNSNPYNVNVDLTYHSGVLAVAGPGSMTIPPGSDSEFQVSVRAELRHPEGQESITITSQVTSAGGAPVETVTQPEDTEIVAVIKQFSALRVALEENPITIIQEEERILIFSVYNDGNGRDAFNLDIPNEQELERSGWSIFSSVDRIEMDSLSSPEKIRITVIAPAQINTQNSSELSNGTKQEVFGLHFRATSDYSIKSEGIPNQDSVEMTIKLLGEEESGLTESLPYPSTLLTIISICLALILIGRRDDYSSSSELREFPVR